MVDDNSHLEHWEDEPSTPYNIEPDDITHGIRYTLNSCQYWVNNLPNKCRYWSDGDPGKCTFKKNDPEHGDPLIPSGWNNTRCDFLGRNIGCSQYSGSDKLEDEYTCVAPNPFISGLYKPKTVGKDLIQYTAVPKADIGGYNEGKCDGCGGGRGSEGHSIVGSDCAKTANTEYRKIPVICKYYRPWHMGFGAIEPKTTSRKLETDKDGFYKDQRDEMEYRVPFNFQVFNARAKLQKCAYWDQDYGTDFVISLQGLIYLESEEEDLDASDLCTCPDSASNPYKTLSDDIPAQYEFIMANVWSEAGEPVCNGAKPNCPCYTGHWIYCVEENLEEGDKISAQQIMELRYWMNDWASQAEYDRVFERKPNINDVSTSDIYTHWKWEVIGATALDHLLKGKKVHMCLPSYRNEFSKDILQVEELTFRNIHHRKKSTNAPEQRTFPNLVRELDFIYTNQLNIVYPYASRDPFEEFFPCEEREDPPPCLKRMNQVEDDSIAVFGSTVRNITLYAFNEDLVREKTWIPPEMLSNDMVFNLTSDSAKEAFYEKIPDFIEALEKFSVGYSTTSDMDGVFQAGPVPLEYQKINTIHVLAVFGDGTYDFRKRKVWSQWHGGVVIQQNSTNNAFEHTYAGVDSSVVNEKQFGFGPAAKASGKAVGLLGANRGYPDDLNTYVAGVTSAYEDVLTDLYGQQTYRFSYCQKKISKQNEQQTRWRKLGNAGHVLVEVDDLNLSYVLGWSFESGKMRISDEEGNTTDQVDLELVWPDGSVVEQYNLPPNMIILKPKGNEKKGFFKGQDWELEIDYFYYTFAFNDDDSENEEIMWPNFDSDGVQFVSPGYSVDAPSSGDSPELDFSVDNIRLETVGVMGMFKDDEGRLVSVFGTKMAVDVTNVYCRSVEIKYVWSKDATLYMLMPDVGWIEELNAPKSLGPVTHVSTPFCGDHDASFLSGNGPMWYPFNNCERWSFYDVWAAGGFCAQPHEDTPRDDQRMRGPEDYDARAASNPSAGQTCASENLMLYSEASGSDKFDGWVKIRLAQHPSYYNAFGWSLPPFGNVSREFTEKYRCIDSMSHISFAAEKPFTSRRWMPMVMNGDSLYVTYNTVKPNGGIYFVNPLNFWLHSGIGESVTEGRKAWDDLFEMRKMILASYPPPPIDDGGQYPKVTFYKFKDESNVWAWQEWWKEVERGNNKQFYVEFERPEYVYDMYGAEHRLIIDESESVQVKFTPPTIDTENGELIKFPSLAIAGGPERWFDIRYSDYESDSGQAEWRDEDSGFVDGGGGDPNPYEQTSGSDWLHDENILFDANYDTVVQAAKDNDKEVKTGYEMFEGVTTKVYNRGLIANISINRLKYLPYDDTDSGATLQSVDPPTDLTGEASKLTGVYRWYNKPSVEIIFSTESSICLSKIEITGTMGTTSYRGQTISVCKPGVGVSTSKNPSGDDWDSLGSTTYTVGVTEGLESYEISRTFTVTPNKMISERQVRVKITLTAPSGDGISINSILLYGANYKDSIETIKVWERKYLTSNGGTGTININGPNSPLMFDFNLSNSGVYFLPTQSPGSTNANDKMRSFHGEEAKTEDEEKDVEGAGAVQSAEQTEQQQLYEKALNANGASDDTNYSVTAPPGHREFFGDLGINFPSGSVTIKSERLPWTKHYLKQDFESHDLWNPGGHYWVWEGTVHLYKCWFNTGEIFQIYRGQFVHRHPAGAHKYVYPPHPLVTLFWGRGVFLSCRDANNTLLGIQKRGYDLSDVWGPPPV